jgi:hypothetical protein
MLVYNPYTGQMDDIPDYADPASVKDQFLPGLRAVAPQQSWQQGALGTQQPPVDTAPQEQTPNDYWSRVAQATGGRGPFGRVAVPGRVPRGLEALMALGSGFANARVGRAANRAKDIEDRNARASAAATTLAQHRYDTARDATQSALDLQRQLAVKLTPAPASANTGTPAKDNLIDVVDPKTGQQRTIRQSEWQPGMNLYHPPKDQSSAQRVRINASQIKQLSDDASVIQQTMDVGKLYKPEFVGPVSGRIGRAKSTLGGIGDQEAAFRTALKNYSAAAKHQLYGSALTETEKADAAQFLPDAINPPKTFEANIAITQRNLVRAAQANRDALDAMNVDISRIKPLPSQVPLFGEAPETPAKQAAPPSGGQPGQILVIRDGRKGYIWPKFKRSTDQVVQ